ncbi:MAG: AAA family ATPase [Gemmatimonadales bacterium]|jgi:tetratricopeptide (TPR) repeat protein
MNRLYGRATELAQLNRVFQEIREGASGRGRLVTLSGETGVGKSALAWAFLDHIKSADSGALTLSSRCVVGRSSYRPFGPILDMLTQLRRLPGNPGYAGAIEKEAPGWLPDAPQSAGRNALFDQFLGLCRAITRQRPLVLFIDELQWCDRSSLDLLARIGASLSSLSVLVLVTYEESTPGGAVSVKGIQHRGGPHAVDLTVRRLEDEAILELAEQLVEGQLAADLRNWVAGAAQGNPLRAENFVRCLLERGLIRKRFFRHSARFKELPAQTSGVYDILASRLDKMEPNLRWTLEAAAFAGSFIDTAVVAAQVGTRVDEVLRHLQTASETHGIVFRLRDPGLSSEGTAARFRFDHPLTRRVLVDRVPEKRRDHLLRRAAEAMERLPGAGETGFVGEIAALYINAGVQDRAHEWSLKAADLAERLYALYEVEEFLRVAARSTDDESERLRIENRLAKVYAATGREPEAEALEESVLERARELGQPATEVQAGVMLGWLQLERGLPPLKLWELAGQMVDKARAEGMTEQLVASLDLSSVVAERVGRAEEALMMAEEALHVAESKGGPDLMAQAAYRLARVHVSWGSPEEGRALAQRALDVFTQMDELVGVAVCHDLLGLANFRAGEWEAALHHWESALESMEVAGVPDQKVAMQVNIADLLTLRGDFQRALEVFRSGLRTAQELDDQRLARRCRTGIARLEFERGDYARVLELTEEIRRLLPESGAWRENFQTTAIRALAYLELGDELQAWQEAARLEQLYQGKEGWFERRAEGDAVRMRVIDLDDDAWLAGTVAQQGIGETVDKDPYGEGFLQYHRACVMARAKPMEARQAVTRAVELFAKLGATPMLTRAQQLSASLSEATDKGESEADEPKEDGIDEDSIDSWFDGLEG